MTILSLGALLGTHRYGFFQSYCGAERPHLSGPIAGQHSGAEKAPAREASRARDLRVPAADAASMLAAGEKMLVNARRLDRPLSVLVLHLPDLPEVELVFGSDAAGQVMDVVMTHLMNIAKANGFASRTAPDMFTLLMPVQAEVVVTAIHARLGKPCCIDFELDGQEILVVPEVMVRTVEGTESVRSVYSGLCKKIDASYGTPLPHRKASCEREVRTVPVEPRPRPPVEKDIPTFFPPLPATIPVPLNFH